MKKRSTPYVYTIFYLDRKYYTTINQELRENNYYYVRAIIPTVNVLKKTARGKMIFEEVPVLFNYGFIKMPSEYAYSRPILNHMKRHVSGIRNFLKSTETLFARKKRARIDNAEDFDDFSLVATCSREDVRRFLQISRHNKKFSLDDLVNIKIGDYVILKGYPYEGIDATVLDVNYTNRTVKLLIYPENGKMELTLPFDNVLYSVYQNYDPDVLYANPLDYNPDNITEESIDNLITRRQL